MTSADSKKPAEIELAYLLTGLRQRGLVVGPDDARKVAVVFAHAADWSQPRRLRALKSLLARSDEERRVIDELAQFLFVQAKKEAERTPESRQVTQQRLVESLETRAGRRSDDKPSSSEEIDEGKQPALEPQKNKSEQRKKAMFTWGAGLSIPAPR